MIPHDTLDILKGTIHICFSSTCFPVSAFELALDCSICMHSLKAVNGFLPCQAGQSQRGGRQDAWAQHSNKQGWARDRRRILSY